MKQNYKISLCALLLAGAVNAMTIGALGADKPTLAVFVVGGDNTLVTPLTTALGTNLTSGGQYKLTSVSTSGKLAELQAAYNAGGVSSIDRNALAEWGRTNGVSMICLVIDDIKGNDHLFSAQLIDTKNNKLSGKGNYVGTGDVSRVSLALSRQLDGPGRRRSAPAPARSYPAELDIEMVFVEGGTFTMGCTAEQSSANICDSTSENTYPHNVTLSSFNMGKYPVTRAQWMVVMKGHATLANPAPNDSWRDEDQLPVTMVSWIDIDTIFLPRLNALTGKNYRLPTEAEWEYAARGCKGNGSGSTATCEGYLYSGSNNVDEVAWHNGNSGGRTHAVGQKKSNGLGIYDMSGNVFEWCRDWANSTYYKSSAGSTNPENTTPESNRVHRGGGATYPSPRDYIVLRSSYTPNFRWADFGFRVVLPAQ
jgi:formylglycine-generating enzyme required for sulfatase activity